MTLSDIKCILMFVLLVAIPSCFSLYKHRIIEIEIAANEGKLLPRSVIPNYYKLKLEPNFGEGEFSGTVEIDVICQSSTNTIMLHAYKTLNIVNNAISVRSHAAGENVPIESVSRNETADLLIIVLHNTMQPGEMYKLHISFSSNFSESYEGFYREEDETSIGEESWYGVTVMYPSYARRVFPCFDEPSFKATFQISVAHPNSMTALSTMPLNHTEPSDKEGWIWDIFTVSPPIATYAVNIVVGHLDLNSSVNIPNKGGNLILQLYNKKNLTIPTIFNLTANIQHIIEELIEYFDAAYPFPKVDFVVLPHAFEHGNGAGLMIGSPTYFDGGLHTIDSFVLHYFNQISTPHGWTDFRILNLLTSYLSDTFYYKVFAVDLYIRMSFRQFDAKYKKLPGPPHYSIYAGEMFFKMLASSLTENTMKRGLAKLITHNNSETFTVDSIWTALTEQGRADGTLVGSVDVQTIAQSWLESECQCYPVMTVTRNYDDNTASLKQEIFLHDVGQTIAEEEQRLWWLPFKYVSPQQLDPSSVHAVAWLGEKYLNVTNLPDSQSFIIANPRTSGYFFVNYDLRNWELITEAFLRSSSNIPYDVRALTFNNVFYLAYAGKLSYAVAFNLTLSLYNETDPLVGEGLSRGFDNIRKHILWTPLEDKINHYLRSLMAKVYEAINYNDDVIITELPLTQQLGASLKIETRNRICLAGYQLCINKLNEDLSKAMSTFQFHDNITHVEFACPEFIRASSDDWLEEFKKFLHFIDKKPYHSRAIYFTNLDKCPGYADAMEQILRSLFDNNLNDTSSVWEDIENVLFNNPVSHNVSLNFVLQHWDCFDETPSTATKKSDLLKGLFSKMKGYNWTEKLLEIKERYGNTMDATCLKSLDFSLKESKDSAMWYNRNAMVIENWIQTIPPHFNINV